MEGQNIENKENDINKININNDLKSLQEEFRNKDDKKMWLINPEESNTFKQDNALTNQIKISKLLKNQENPMTLFEMMDESSFADMDFIVPEIPKIIFTEEELEGENEKTLNDLLKLPEFMIGDSGHIKENKKLNKTKTAYTPQKKGQKAFFTTKIKKENSIKGNDINLEKLNLKNLNIYQAKTKNNKYLKNNNKLKSTNEDAFDKNNYFENYNTYNGNKAIIHQNNLNLLSIKSQKNSQIFVKKKPEKIYSKEQNIIEDKTNNLSNKG